MARPNCLRVVMLDTYRTEVAIMYENEHIPYSKRLVTIHLTEEQCQQLEPRVVGQDSGKDRHEEIGGVWLDCEDAPEKPRGPAITTTSACG